MQNTEPNIGRLVAFPNEKRAVILHSSKINGISL